MIILCRDLTIPRAGVRPLPRMGDAVVRPGPRGRGRKAIRPSGIRTGAFTFKLPDLVPARLNISGSYVARTAINDASLVDVAGQSVTFRWKNRKKNTGAKLPP